MLGRTAGGSDTCLFLLLKNIDRSRYEPHLLYRDNSPLLEELKEIGIKIIATNIMLCFTVFSFFAQKIREYMSGPTT